MFLFTLHRIISTNYQQSVGYVDKEEIVSTPQTVEQIESKDLLSSVKIDKDDLERITVLGVGGFGCVELVNLL